MFSLCIHFLSSNVPLLRTPRGRPSSPPTSVPRPPPCGVKFRPRPEKLRRAPSACPSAFCWSCPARRGRAPGPPHSTRPCPGPLGLGSPQLRPSLLSALSSGTPPAPSPSLAVARLCSCIALGSAWNRLTCSRVLLMRAPLAGPSASRGPSPSSSPLTLGPRTALGPAWYQGNVRRTS